LLPFLLRIVTVQREGHRREPRAAHAIQRLQAQTIRGPERYIPQRPPAAGTETQNGDGELIWRNCSFVPVGIRELLVGNARFVVVSLVRKTRRRLAPVRTLNEYITRMIDTGQINLDYQENFGEKLLLAMAETNEISGTAFVYPDGSTVRVARGRGILPPETPGEGAGSGPFMENTKSRYQSFWGAPI
jgi:hypothetical protein